MVNHPNRSKWPLAGRKLTTPQIRVLIAARDKGGAVYAPGSRMGGATRRMIHRLVADHLLVDSPPFPITQKGHQELAAFEAGAPQ
jgi:hypothetical protein